MGDAESNVQPSKKRAAGRELSRDNPGLDDEEGSSEQEIGTFKRASEEVLAARRIVKVRRNQSSTTPSAPSSNPFAGIRLVPPNSGATTALFTAEADSGKSVADNEVKPVGSEEIDGKTDENRDEEIDGETDENKKESESRLTEPDTETIPEKENNDNEEGPNKLEVADEKAGKLTSNENNIEKDDEENAEFEENAGVKASENEDNAEVKESENEDKKDDDNASVDKSGEAASFSSFQQLSSSRNAFTGLSGTGFSSTTFSFGSLGSGSLFGSKVDSPSFGFGLSNNGSSSLFGSSGASTVTNSEGSGFPSMQEVPVETGEENEKPVFVADAVLFEYFGGSWKERGKGELKVNVPTAGTGKARLVMRTRGNYRLILNASLYPDMKLTDMEKRGVTFACVNSVSDGKDGLSTFALRFKDASIVDEFRACVIEHKAKNPVTLKTPENSPKASDE